MNNDDERDYVEEAYWRNYCGECDGPCRSDDGHRAEDAEYLAALEADRSRTDAR